MSGTISRVCGISRSYFAFVGLLSLVAFIVLVPRADRFPYQGTWRAGSPAQAYTATFHFAPSGACTTDYVTGNKHLKSIPCTYVMENGAAVMEYAHNWKQSKVDMTNCDYVWYHARLTPIEGGRALMLKLLDGTSRKQQPGKPSVNQHLDFKDDKEVRFERVN